MNCKDSPDKCLIDQDYCPSKVNESYDTYCTKSISCNEQPDKCIIGDQYCPDKVSADYD